MRIPLVGKSKASATTDPAKAEPVFVKPPEKKAETVKPPEPKTVNDPRLVELAVQMRRDISYVAKHWGNTYIERRVKEIATQMDALGIS